MQWLTARLAWLVHTHELMTPLSVMMQVPFLDSISVSLPMLGPQPQLACLHPMQASKGLCAMQFGNTCSHACSAPRSTSSVETRLHLPSCGPRSVPTLGPVVGHCASLGQTLHLPSNNVAPECVQVIQALLDICPGPSHLVLSDAHVMDGMVLTDGSQASTGTSQPTYYTHQIKHEAGLHVPGLVKGRVELQIQRKDPTTASTSVLGK